MHAPTNAVVAELTTEPAGHAEEHVVAPARLN